MENGNSFNSACTREGVGSRGCTPWLYLSPSASFQHTYRTHIPALVLILLAQPKRDMSLRLPASRSPLPEATEYPVIFQSLEASSWALGPPSARLGGWHRGVTPNVRTGQKGVEDCREAASGPTFMSCSSWSCRRLRSSSSSSSRPLDLRLGSAPSPQQRQLLTLASGQGLAPGQPPVLARQAVQVGSGLDRY